MVGQGEPRRGRLHFLSPWRASSGCWGHPEGGRCGRSHGRGTACTSILHGPACGYARACPHTHVVTSQRPRTVPGRQT